MATLHSATIRYKSKSIAYEKLIIIILWIITVQIYKIKTNL